MSLLEHSINNIIVSTGMQYLYLSQLNYIGFICDAKDFIICIYTNNLFNNINGFLQEIYIIQQYYQKPILGIYCTFMKPLNSDEKIINNVNKKNYNKIINIYNSDINILTKMFVNILYEYKIYCYDASGDCIMLS